MTAQEQFQLERKPVNSALHDGLVDAAHLSPGHMATLAAAAPVASTNVRRSLGLPTAATFNVPLAGNVSAAMNQARDGEVVGLVAGTYPQPSAFTCTSSNFTLSGVPGSTVLKFQTGGPFAITFSNPAFGVVFDGVAIDNNGGCIVFNRGTVDCVFRRSTFKFNGSGSSACGIRSLGGDVRQKIDQSLFCDSPNSYRDIDSYGQTDCSYTNNSFIGTCYGPHIDGPKSGVITYTGNTGTMWNRNMGVEVQDHNTTQGSGRVIFKNNVFYGFGPGITNNTYLASLPVQNSGDLLVDGNYLCLGDFVTEAAAAVLATKGYKVFPNSKGADGLVYVEAPQVGGSNIGIGIENGSSTTTCTNNIVIGSVCVSIVTCQPNTKVSGNKTHGRKKNGNWGNVAYSGEPGNRPASFIPSDPSTSNTIIEVIDGNTPRPPRRARRDPWNDDGTTIPPDNPMAKIISPAPGTVFAPGDTFTLVTQDNVKSAVDFIGDGKNAVEFTGNSFISVVPPNATSIVVSGAVSATYAVKAGTVTPPPPPPGTTNYHVEEIASFDIIDGAEKNRVDKRIITKK